MTAPKPAGPKPVGSNPVGSKPAGSKPGAGSGMVNKPSKKGGKRSEKRDAEDVMERRDHQNGMLSIRTLRPAARGSTCVPFKCGNTTCVTGQCKKGPKVPKPKPAAA
ncbi:hypothetical protein B0O99DRAFT_640772 [Bisporella sp. PMI_857]|nr:hypothetical protein B0O99DRAFT_640772 [Bisporella sp. PMI_857]